MTFTSISFVVFFVVVTTLYYFIPHRFRWALLLVASCYFYMAFVPKYILILFALILIDYILALFIEKSAGRRKRTLLLCSILSNVGILFVFKYFNFFNENISALATLLHWNYSVGMLRLLLPLGLSFHTFQSLSYVIEVYRGKYPAEHHLGIYALYVMFFPQLVAGPIERPQHLLAQLHKPVHFDWDNIFSGIRLMLWGFFKKLVIADRLAISVDYIYSNFSHLPGLSPVIATLFFAFQLYTDFSGYSDIARGSARALGIDVVRNFQQPYFSRSIAEFWRRWHISLSTWFRDYFYFPLAMSSRQTSRWWLYICILLTFIVTGLWHGAGWTFIVMGFLFGFYIVFGLVSKVWRDNFAAKLGFSHDSKPRAWFQTIFTFLLVAFTWIFFRAPTIQTAFSFIATMFTSWIPAGNSFMYSYFIEPFPAFGFGRGDLLLALGGISLLLSVEYLEIHQALSVFFTRQPIFVRSFIYSGLALSIIVLSVYTSQQFIYFQF